MALELLDDHSRQAKAVSQPRRLVEKTLEVRFVIAGCPEIEPQTPALQGSRDGAGDERIKADDLDTGNISGALSHAPPMPKCCSPRFQILRVTEEQTAHPIRRCRTTFRTFFRESPPAMNR